MHHFVAQILHVHTHIHICHLTSNASEKAKEIPEILILAVILQREERKTQIQKGGMVHCQAASHANSTSRTLSTWLWVLGSSPPTPHLHVGQEVVKSPLSGAPCPCL